MLERARKREITCEELYLYLYTVLSLALARTLRQLGTTLMAVVNGQSALVWWPEFVLLASIQTGHKGSEERVRV
jgi:hypothetical protein